jgi:hypothetical protein
MQSLSLESVMAALEFELAESLPRQMLRPDHPLYGAYISPQTQLDEAGHGGTSRFLMTCGLVLLWQLKKGETVNQDILQRMNTATDYLLRAQRESGLIDLRNVNYDSAPDTGFAVQLLCAFYHLARDKPIFAEVLSKLETFIRRAAPGMMAGGFHTPNHRWVIVAALAQTMALFDIDVGHTIRAYLDEGFDVDEEGTYLERSIGVYDAVTNRSLLLLAEHWDDADDLANIQKAVTANLNFNLHFFHADGTAETGLSRRQDYGTRQVPVPLIASYLQANALYPNPLFVQAAQWLWRCAPLERGDVAWQWQAYVMFKHGEPEPSKAVLPQHYQKYYPINQVWRVRQGELSATVYGGVSKLMSLVYGQAYLCSLNISQTYFGIGNFVGDELGVKQNQATLHYHGSLRLHRPGYDLPLGRAVSREAWEEMQKERDYKPLPAMKSILEITALDQGFDFHYQTLDGLDKVLVQMAFDFPAGGFWETEDTGFRTVAGQQIFLKRGQGQMRFDNDAIEISPGANAHLYESMRASEPVAEGLCRVLLTFLTPVSHPFSLRVTRGV